MLKLITRSGEFIENIGQAKDYTIGICCFSAKHATLKRKSKD
jgi:hypothetical protein